MTIEQQKSIDFFKETIIEIMHNEYKKPLGQVLHDCGLAKANIKRQFPKYEKKNSVNKSDNYDWDAFFSENMTPDFEIEHNVKWPDGRKSDAIKYNKYAPTNTNKLGDNAIIITKDTKKSAKNEDVKQTEKPELKQIKLTDMDNTENQNQGDIRERIEKILSYLNQNLYGKEEAVRLALLSAIANESIFFLGPPGTAKSMISRRIAAAFSDFYKDGNFTIENGDYFEYLMNEFSTPDEICGPVDLSALNENPSRYERQIKGYLPSAKVAFLDEIWKSGPAILNTLLTIINEKKFHNGNKVEKVPLVSLAAASNELPQKDRGLEALWDRFVLRVLVNPVENEDDFFNIVDDENKELKPSPEQFKSLLSIEDVTKWQELIDMVELSDEAKNIITSIRQELTLRNKDENHKEGEAYYVSDRRWKKIVHILKTSAFLNGRDAVDLMDCSLIEYAIWNTNQQHNEVEDIVESILGQNGITVDDNDAFSIEEDIKDFRNDISKQFFKGNSKKTPCIKEMIDKTEAYELKHEVSVRVEKTIGYWSYEKINFISEEGNYYDYRREKIDSPGTMCRDIEYNEDSESIEWINEYDSRKYSESVKVINDNSQLRQKTVVSEDDGYFEYLKRKTDEKYNEIKNEITSCFKKLENYSNNESASFKNNLFAENKYCEVILSAVEKSKRNLEDLEVELKKERERYAYKK